MAYDGFTVAATAKELSEVLTGARVYKIAQTESDELLITFKTPEDKGFGRQVRLLMTARASLPLIYLTDRNKPSPDQAPAFCMLLRKYLQNGRVLFVEQPSFERIIRIGISHLDEMGDPRTGTLLIELMGKHSNIIFVDGDNTIVDAIRRVPLSVSSVREVLPGRPYFVPDKRNRRSPLEITDIVTFTGCLSASAKGVGEALPDVFSGISAVTSQEMCYRADIDASHPFDALSYEERMRLFDAFSHLTALASRGDFSPVIYYEHNAPAEYAAFPLTMYERKEGASAVRYDHISPLLAAFYAEKNANLRIRQKSADLRHIVQVALERAVRKYDLQLKQIRDTEKREKYRLYGELLTAYAWQIAPGEKKVTLTDYHTDESVTVPLDETLTAMENAARYYDRYNKMKRTFENLTEQIKSSGEQIKHLESIRTALSLSQDAEDLAQIRSELIQEGYLKEKTPRQEKGGRKRKTPAAKPLHFRSRDGFDFYVGKNNFQNDEITFRLAAGNDWWFHAKGAPGSHVILKCDGKELPDRAFEEAAALAAYYSAAADQNKVEIDYLQRKNVKKPNGAKPGFVVYYTNYSMIATPDISALEQVE